MDTQSLVTLQATELRRLIGIQAISPVELLEACIARIEALDPAVNAIAARAFDTAGGLRQGRHSTTLQRSALQSKLKMYTQSARLRHE